MMGNDVQDLLDRRLSIMDAIEAGVADKDIPFLSAELAEIAAALASQHREASPASQQGAIVSQPVSRITPCAE